MNKIIHVLQILCKSQNVGNEIVVTAKLQSEIYFILTNDLEFLTQSNSFNKAEEHSELRRIIYPSEPIYTNIRNGPCCNPPL